MRPLNKGKKQKVHRRELIKAKKAAAPSATDDASTPATEQPLQANAGKSPPALIDASLLAGVKGRPGVVAGVDASNALLMEAKKKERPPPPSLPTAKPLSRREQRKLAKLAEQKVKAADARLAYSSIASHALTAEQQRLLHSSGEMGKTETARERIRRQFREEKLGIRTADESAAHRYHRWTGEGGGQGEDGETMEEDREEKEGDEELKEEEVKALLSRKRKRPGMAVNASSLPSSVVSSYGLDPTRWRSTANAEGHIAFDTHRVISYGSSDDGDSHEDEDEDSDDEDMSEEGAEEEHKAGDEGGEEEEEEEAMAADVTAAAAPPPRREGLFSVPFDVIATSNRPKRQRRVILSKHPPPPDPHSVAEDAEAHGTDIPMPPIPSPDSAPITHSPDVMDEASDALPPSPPTHPFPLPLISLRGKAKFAAVPDPSPFLPSGPATTGRFIRAPKPVLTRLPLAPGAVPYAPTSPSASRVSYNDARLGEGGIGVSEELDVRRKGEAIMEDTADAPPDLTPHLWTREHPPGHCVVYVNRPPALQHARLSLPIASFEQEVIEALNSHHTLIIEGSTGSGKTTQLPQFLFENGYGFGARAGAIGVTQPRRVAAVTTCQRVAEEMNLPLAPATPAPFDPTPTLRYLDRLRQHRARRHLPDDPGVLTPLSPYGVIAHAVRYDSRVSASTRIQFMTDGILLREVAADFLLSRYSVVVIDEAHERGRNTDVLIGLVSRSVVMREKRWKEGTAPSPLKLIIMSATLRTADFTANPRLFPSPPPVLSIPARQHKVVVHYSRVTVLDGYMEAMLTKVMRMHVKLPEGGVLVFLNGKEEIDWMCEKVEQVWRDREKRRRRVQLLQGEGEERTAAKATVANGPPKSAEEEEEEALYALGDETTGDEDDDAQALRDEDDEAKDAAAVKAAATEQMEDDLTDLLSSASPSSSRQPLTPYCLPLYSLLPTHLQLRVFAPPPSPLHRLLVFATNVAETSLTIPGIRYVLDSGREKRRTWDRTTGCVRYEVGWISKASAEQRKGRAGRTGPGHAYRMYSAAVYEQRMAEQAEPELLREPLDTVVLTMKAMGIDKVRQFPFPTPPEAAAVAGAEEALRRVGAVDREGRVTELGRRLVRWPVAPRYARMIALGHQGDCLRFILAIVSALSVEQLLLRVRLKDGVEGEEDGGEDEEDEGGEERLKEKDRKRLKRKALHEKLMKARQRWTHPDSDLLTYLRVIGGFEFATRDDRRGGGSKEEREKRRRVKAEAFCKDNFVRLKAMEEVALLRRQLTRIAVQLSSGRQPASGEEVRGEEEEEAESTDVTPSAASSIPASLTSPMLPPTPVQERLLRQMLLSGMVDHVARKMSEEEKRVALASGAVGEGTNLSGAYSLLLSPHPAWIHPTSVLFPATAQPLYCLYHRLQLSTGGVKQYLMDCSVIDEASLCLVGDGAGLVQWGGWLEQPKPQFNRETDRVEGWKRPSFGVGDRRWELQPTTRGWGEGGSEGGQREREYREFVRLLLQGEVFEELRAFVPFLAVNPSHVCQVGSMLSGKHVELVRRCAREGIRSRRQLREQWSVDSRFLLKEYTAWVQPSKQPTLHKAWPPKE